MRRFPIPSAPTPPTATWSCLLLSLLMTAAGCSQRIEPVVDQARPVRATVPATAADPEPAAVASELTVRYLANEGFLVEGAGQRVLIDALFGSGIGGYPAAPPDLRSALETGSGDWSGVDLALASHFHGDHFDAAAVARFLAANPRATFASTPQAIAALEAVTDDAALLARARAILPAEGTIRDLELAGIRVEFLNLHHGRRPPIVENLGVIVHLAGRRFIHFGDTEAKMPDFEPYLAQLEEPDVALLPFWFLASEWRAGLVRATIRPRALVAAHVPTPDAPRMHFARWESYDGLIASMREAFPDAEIPTTAGETFVFPASAPAPGA